MCICQFRWCRLASGRHRSRRRSSERSEKRRLFDVNLLAEIHLGNSTRCCRLRRRRERHREREGRCLRLPLCEVPRHLRCRNIRGSRIQCRFLLDGWWPTLQSIEALLPARSGNWLEFFRLRTSGLRYCNLRKEDRRHIARRRPNTIHGGGEVRRIRRSSLMWRRLEPTRCTVDGHRRWIYTFSAVVLWSEV